MKYVSQTPKKIKLVELGETTSPSSSVTLDVTSYDFKLNWSFHPINLQDLHVPTPTTTNMEPDHNPSSVFCTSTGWWRHLWHWVCVSWCSNRLLFSITASILDGWLNWMNLKTNMHESTAMTCKSVIISHLNGAKGSEFKCQPGRYLSLSISRKALRICNSQRHLCGTKRWRKNVCSLQHISQGDAERS